MMKKRILLVVILLVVLGVLGGGGFYAYKTFFAARPPEAEPTPAVEPKVTLGPVYPMDPYLVNLADVGSRPRFLKVVIQLELNNDTVSTELDGIKPKVRDAMLTLLSSKTSADLVTVADKERLRNEIIHRLNAYLSTGKVQEVYFIEFVVQ